MWVSDGLNIHENFLREEDDGQCGASLCSVKNRALSFGYLGALQTVFSVGLSSGRRGPVSLRAADEIKWLASGPS